jgi:hypothetical protein
MVGLLSAGRPGERSLKDKTMRPNGRGARGRAPLSPRMAPADRVEVVATPASGDNRVLIFTRTTHGAQKRARQPRRRGRVRKLPGPWRTGTALRARAPGVFAIAKYGTVLRSLGAGVKAGYCQ